MRYLIITTACALAFGLVACGAGARRMPPASELIAQGRAPAGAEAASLDRGRALAATKCAGCHRLFWPHDFAPTAWPGIVANMGRRAGLDDRQIAEVTAYLVAASSPGDRPDSPARR